MRAGCDFEREVETPGGMKDHAQRFLRYLAVERHASPHTLRAYRIDLEDFGRFCAEAHCEAVADIDPRLVRAYLAHLHRRGLDPVSVARHLSTLRSCLRFLVRRGVVERNAARDVRSPRLPRKLVSFLPVDEALPVVEARGLAGRFRPRDLAIIELLYASGLRVSELTSLDLDDLDHETLTVRVLGKGSKERIVPFGRGAARALGAYLGARRGWREAPSSSTRAGDGSPLAACRNS